MRAAGVTRTRMVVLGVLAIVVVLGLRYFVVSPSDGQPKDHLLMAAAILTALPPIIIFFIGQRYFVRGVVTSGIKG